MPVILLAAFVTQTAIAGQAPAQQQQQPQPKATAVIRGRVIAGDTSQPARRAQVRLTMIGRTSGPPPNLSVTVDADGNYEFAGLLPGRYVVNVSKTSYVDQATAAQPGNARPPLEIREGQVVEHVDLVLLRGAVVTGRVFDEVGDPISGVQVTALRAQGTGDQQRFMSTSRPSSTDDLGSFRIFGLMPGEYVVQAQWRPNMPSSAEALGRTGYAATYFPGTTDPRTAQRFVLRPNQSITDVAMSLVPVTTVRVSGSVVDSHGASPSGGVLLTRSSNGSQVMGPMFTTSASLRDGKFLFPGVAPGEYILRTGGGPNAESGTMELAVGADDIEGLLLTMSPPLKVSGRILVEPGAAPPPPPTLMLMPVAQGIGISSDQRGTAASDFTFDLKAPPGVYRLQVSVPGPWTIRAIRVGGADVTDDGIEVKPGRSITGIEVDVTNRAQTITALVSASAEQLKDSAVLVFPSDAKRMKNAQRYVRTLRPGPDGRITIVGLPPGDYNVIALEHYSPGPTPDAEFFDRQRPHATSITLLEGETRTIDLRLNSVS
ncbi:MAG TPA: carboxypeptidase-like regulatory domain-containing protein [Vicinamibacterales bacterium]|nr:carboxypeptidase-like regulatory domain-containing protein [Vicinamibacterales bacterium]